MSTTVCAKMNAYLRDSVARFDKTTETKVRDAATPFRQDAFGSELQCVDTKYGHMAASPLMSLLYAARCCRPELNTAVTRLARRVSKWSPADDAKFERLMGYARASADSILASSLSTKDRQTAVVRCWPDADLAGNPTDDARSTSGIWAGIASEYGARSMPVHWSARRQTSVAGSTCESELAALCETMQQDAVPSAALMEFLVRRPLRVEAVEDNDAAIVAARARYSGNMRHLQRTRRIHLGVAGRTVQPRPR